MSGFKTVKSQTSQNHDISRKVSHRNHQTAQWLSVKEASDYLGKAQNTIIHWCENGKLYAVPTAYGGKTSYRIPLESVIAMWEALKNKQKASLFEMRQKRRNVSHKQLISTWDRYCEQGLINGKPYSSETRKINSLYLTYFLDKYEEASFINLKAELLEIPVEKFGKREKIYKVLKNFIGWLMSEGMVEPEEYDQVCKIKVKRMKPPKRHVLREDELDKLEEACENSYERVIVVLLSHTGMRASEFCKLNMASLNLERREIKFLGKGNKERWVGLTTKASDALLDYLREYPVSDEMEPIFKDRFGKPLTRNGLRSRLIRIGEKVGIDAHPHAMRRSFVTVNVAKGRNLVDLQLLCGHSDIKTTRSYCQTSQEEAVNRMKDWN